MDCIVTVWTSCEAVIEERWTLRAPPDVICALKAGDRSPLELLNADDVELLGVENVAVHSEGTREATRVEVTAPEARPATRRP